MGGIFTPNSNFSPLTYSAFWWDVDDNATVNGGNPASLIDKKAGYLLTPVGATGGTMRTTRWNGQKCIEQNLQAWKCTQAGVANVFNGGNNWWCMLIGMWIPQTNLMPDGTLWSAGLSTDAQKYMGLKSVKSIGSQQWIQRFGAGAETQDNSSEFQGQFPYLWYFTRDTVGVTAFYRDGLIEQTFTRNPAGALGVDTVVVGGLIQGGSITVDGSFWWRHFLGNSGSLTPTVLSQIYNNLANNTQGLSAKKGITGGLWTGTTYIDISGPGQSNDQGQGAAPGTTVTAPNAYFIGFDSFIKTLADPWASNTNTAFPGVFINSGISSYAPSYVNTMWSRGTYTINDAVLMIPNGVGGSSMGSFWCDSYNVSPPPWNKGMGAWKLRLIEAKRNMPNPKLRRVNWYQGESESTTLVAANAWGDINRAQAIRTEIESFVTSIGLAWESAVHHIVTILPVTPWTGGPFWANVRTSQQNFAALFADCQTVQAPDGPWTDGTDLHINKTALDALGVLYGNTI